MNFESDSDIKHQHHNSNMLVYMLQKPDSMISTK